MVMSRRIVAICLCSLLCAFCFNSAAQEQSNARDLYLGFGKTANKPPKQRRGRPGSKIKMELMRNEQLTTVTTQHELLDDDRIAFRTAVNYKGYLIVTNIGTSGKVNLLYAGQISPTNDLRIPEKGWIRVTGKSGDEVVNFIMSSRPIQELQKIGILNSSSSAADLPGQLDPKAEAQRILVQLNGRALNRERDLVVENSGNETYALAASVQQMTAPIGFSIRLKHK
jgi:hypothetical protein